MGGESSGLSRAGRGEDEGVVGREREREESDLNAVGPKTTNSG